MDLMNAQELLLALRDSGKSRTPMGQTRLDLLISDALHNPELLAEIEHSLSETIQLIETDSEWHTAQLLVSQLSIRNARLGERVFDCIVNQNCASKSKVWMGFLGTYLGGTMNSNCIAVLSSVISEAPVQWFALMRQTQERAAVDAAFFRLSELRQLSSSQALEIARSYKRWAIEHNLSWNVQLSQFIAKLPVDLKQSIGDKLARSFGPTFKVVHENTAMANTMTSLMTNPGILTIFQKLTSSTGYSRQAAMAA
jgi:hypothetical protein